jgi:polyisoprenoid-binding protein YceI
MKAMAMRMIVLSLTAACFLTASHDRVFSASKINLTAVRYRIDPAKSTFIVHANRTGIAWFKGHSHRIAVKDFGGMAELDLSALNPASLQLTVQAASLEETDPVFTPEQKKIINKEVNELVLETAKYPEIIFKSADIKGSIAQGKFNVQIGGDLTLHGVTKHIVIPATVTVSGDELRATGEFGIDRKDFNVNATEAFHGFVKVKHHLKFEFDIVGTRIT